MTRTSTQEKVAFLGRPRSYAEQPRAVEVIETHMSWVFLTDRHAYKLKKPVRWNSLDFSTPELRRHHCEEELRLNRRLAAGVYLGVIALTVEANGALALGGAGKPVDWLVQMRRLPAARMLDRLIREGHLVLADVRPAALRLACLYAEARPIPLAPSAYRKQLAEGVCSDLQTLRRPEFRLPSDRVRAIADAQLQFLERHAALFDQRAREGRIVEGHGDLRPEHVCLGVQPLVIDCLEFNRDWRVLDPADELAYLALECVHAGAAWIGDVALASYREQAADPVPAGLLAFYQAYRAGIRARLCAWHLHDHPDPADQGRWIARAQRYLDLAQRRACADPVRP